MQSSFYPMDNASMGMSLSYLSYYVNLTTKMWVKIMWQWKIKKYNSQMHIMFSNYIGCTGILKIWNYLLKRKKVKYFLIFRANNGLYSINALRQRAFSSLGSLQKSSLEIIEGWEKPENRCTLIRCLPPPATLVKIDTTQKTLGVACKGIKMLVV